MSDDVRLYSVEHDAKIIDWRASCFRHLGFTDLVADLLAVRRDVDRQVVSDMLAAGCPHATARDILL